MHTKTMKGLIGARTNMEILNTPFRVYKEARRKGDLAKMEQAMGYMSDYKERATEYQETADKGMKEDTKEAKEKAEELRKEADQARREKQEAFEKRLEENRREGKGETPKTDSVAISEEGRLLQETEAARQSDFSEIDSGSQASAASGDAHDKEPVFYSSTGETLPAETPASLSVSV